MNEQDKFTALQHAIILDWIETGATVLDLGCGDGALLERLVKEKQARAQGIELDGEDINRCVGRGLSVCHGDIDSGLAEYGNRSFDYVILNHSIQQVRHPQTVLFEALRVGKRIIVGLPNFGHWSARWQLGVCGRVPVTPSLPYQWFDTPNLHFLTLRDFLTFCRQRNITVEKSQAIDKRGKINLFPNLRGESGLFMVGRGDR